MDVIEYLADHDRELAQASTRHNDNVYSLVNKEHAEKVRHRGEFIGKRVLPLGDKWRIAHADSLSR